MRFDGHVIILIRKGPGRRGKSADGHDDDKDDVDDEEGWLLQGVGHTQRGSLFASRRIFKFRIYWIKSTTSWWTKDDLLNSSFDNPIEAPPLGRELKYSVPNLNFRFNLFCCRSIVDGIKFSLQFFPSASTEEEKEEDVARGRGSRSGGIRKYCKFFKDFYSPRIWQVSDWPQNHC